MKSRIFQIVAAVILLLPVMNTQVLASGAAEKVVESARAECLSLDNGVLSTDPQKTISLADLTGDDQPEEIVDGNQFSCSTAASLFCGTGGCALTVIVGEKPFEFLAKAWKVEETSEGNPVLKIAVHWSQCDYKSPCWESFNWDGSGFASLGSKAEE